MSRLFFQMGAYRDEARKTLKLAFPMIIGQLATMGMGITDAAMVGRGLGTDPLAALTFALNFVNIPYISLWGLVSATGITMAQVYGARQHERLPAVLRHGAVLAVAVAVFFIALMMIGYQFLPRVDYLGQDPRIVALGHHYFIYYSCAFITYLIGGCCKSACESQNKPWLPLGVMACAISLNVGLNWVFMFGHLGAPRMGLDGAGLATLLSNICFDIAMITMVTRRRELGLPFREVFRPRFSWAQFRHLAQLGMPTSAQIAMEVGSFVIAAMMIGHIGPQSLAAHHITLQVAAFSFMVPLGLSFAVAIRISHQAGAGDMERVRRIGNGAFVLVAGWMALAGTLILLNRRLLAGAFSSDPVVVGLAVKFMMVAALFQVFDGLQTTAVGALRGLRDVRLPTILIMLDYWVISLPLAWALGFPLGYGGVGIWCALLIALFLAAVTLTWRFRVISRRPPGPALAGDAVA